MAGSGTSRSITDLFSRLGPRRPGEPEAVVETGAVEEESVFPTKALQKFLSSLTAHESPVLLDLGPVVGSNVSFFGEQLGCKIFVEDLYADLDRHVRRGALEEMPEFLAKRFPRPDATVHGILCWDLLDYLDRPAAQTLAAELTRLLRPDGALLGFFGTAQPRETHYTKYVVVDELNLRHRPYPASRARQGILLNREIIRMFEGLRVSDSFLLKTNLREILFRKPGDPAGEPGASAS